MNQDEQRSAILAYNTVERLLKGDFFHFTRIEDIASELSSYNAEWPVIGVGTTNWFRRNGEAIVEGKAAEARFLWADPSSEPVGRVVDLFSENPESPDKLKSPYIGEDETKPQFPFLAVAVCNPETKRRIRVDAGENIHDWVIEKLAKENIGLAAVSFNGSLEQVRATAAYHLPIGGVTLHDGYAQGETFKFNEFDSGVWSLQGLYAVNPTLQEVISVAGNPLHLHGYDMEGRIGGHITQAFAACDSEISIYPIQDINIRIRDLDQAILPFQHLE